MENNNKILITIIVILSIVVLGLGGLILYDKVLKDKEIEKEDIDNINEIGKELFLMTNLSDLNSGLLFYDEKNLTIQNMSDENKLITTMLSIPSEKINYDNWYWEDPYNRLDSCTNENPSNESITQYTCYSRKIIKKDFNYYYNKLFGNNNNIYYKEFLLSTNKNDVLKYETCNLESGEVTCYPFDGGDGINYFEYIEFKNAKLNNDNLEVMVYYLVVDGYTKEINNIKFGDKVLGLIDPKNLTKEEIFQKYKDQAGIYKLTFKKDSNDSWHWISTSIENSD